MNKAVLKAELFKATQAAFEQVAFMFAAPLEEPADDTAPLQAVAVEIEGGFGGRMVLAISQALLPVLAANMLGDDEPLPADQQRDALGEMANIICGAVLPALGGPDSVFRITSPVVTQLDVERARPDAGDAVSVEIGLEDGHADVLLWLR